MGAYTFEGAANNNSGMTTGFKRLNYAPFTDKNIHEATAQFGFSRQQADPLADTLGKALTSNYGSQYKQAASLSGMGRAAVPTAPTGDVTTLETTVIDYFKSLG